MPERNGERYLDSPIPPALTIHPRTIITNANIIPPTALVDDAVLLQSSDRTSMCDGESFGDMLRGVYVCVWGGIRITGE